METHKQGLTLLHHANYYDRLNVVNSVAVELVLRQVQLVERRYSLMQDCHSAGKGGNGGRAAKTPGGHVGGLFDEAAAFGGPFRSHGRAMVCPDVIVAVGQIIERDANILKQQRKANEEQKLATKASTAGGGKDD